MNKHTLYAYIDGSDLEKVAASIESDLSKFVDDNKWLYDTWVVNQCYPVDETHKAGDLPDWDLGLNMILPDPDKEKSGWFSDIIKVAHFFRLITFKI